MNKEAVDLSQDLNDYNFELPEELIAQSPATLCEEARLLIVRKNLTKGLPRFEDLQIKDLPQLIESEERLKDSLWLRNRSKVLPARFYSKRASGSEHEIVLLKEIKKNVWKAIIRGVAKFKYPQKLFFKENSALNFVSTEAGVVDFSQSQFELQKALEDYGQMPLPPYISNRERDRDMQRYQSCWALEGEQKSAAAPTASLHFNNELLAKLKKQKVDFADIVLHVGLGTFEPLRNSQIEENSLHSEEYFIASKELQTIKEAMLNNKNLLCIGSTALRCFESVNWKKVNANQNLNAETELFIKPGFNFQYNSSLLTNFHLPKSSLMVMLSTFAGSRKLVLEAYQHAIKKKYRFFSYGDASLWI